MKRISTLTVGLGTAAVLSLAACTSVGGVNSTADSGSNAAGSSAAKKAVSAKKSTGPAKVGQAITIKGNAAGSQIKITAIKVVDPVKSSNEFDTPDSGNRYVGVQFRITNTGTATYDDAPSNGAKLIDKSGQQFDTTLIIGYPTSGAALPASVKLGAGSAALGYLVFEVPTGSKVAKVQFSADSGFGDTAEWVA